MHKLVLTLAASMLLATSSANAENYIEPIPAPGGGHYVGPVMSAPVAPLFTCVKVEDPDNIHPCAVPTIIQVPDPCASHDPCCGPACVSIQICAPPCGCPEIKTSRHGRKIKYDYGKYEVEITVRDGYVKVDYDD